MEEYMDYHNSDNNNSNNNHNSPRSQGVEDDSVQTGWHQHHESHAPRRRSMINHIASQIQPNNEQHPLLPNDAPVDPLEDQRKIFRVAKTVEWYLYKNAMSMEEYEDPLTLRNRMRVAVREIYSSAGRVVPDRHRPAPHIIQDDGED